jgi:TRAP-type C4-dicarboxylate transport system permease small subunit
MNEQPDAGFAKESTPPEPQPGAEEKGLITLCAGLPILSKNPKDDNKKSILKMTEFKVYVDLYKFFLKLSLSVNVFYLAVLGGLLTFIFRPVENQPDKVLVDTLPEPVKLVLLITPFILSCVIMLSFAMGAWYWWISTIAINRKIKAEDVEVKLITRPFFHLLTWLLAAITIIFMVVTFLLGWIMRTEGVLFCNDCLLGLSNLPWVVGTAFTVVILSLLVRNYLLGKIKYGRKKNRKQQVTADSKRIYLIALIFACIFIASTTILLGDVGLVFHRTFDTSTWIVLSTTIVSAIGTISTIILAWKNERRTARENELKIARLERELEAVRESPAPPNMDRRKDDSEGVEPVSEDVKDSD